MRVDTSNTMFSNASVGLGTSFVDRLQSMLLRPAGDLQPVDDVVDSIESPSPETWTSTMLRNQLLQLDVSANDKNLGIADALTKVGIPISLENIQAANHALGAAKGAAAISFALATAWDLPTSPAVLRALSAVTAGIKPELQLPPELVGWLGLALNAETDSETLAGHLNHSLKQVTRSTEHKLLNGTPTERAGASTDVRSLLLKLAGIAVDRPTKHAASFLALHVEGQQLINQASANNHSTDQPNPIYFAVPLQIQDQLTMVEFQMWPREEIVEEDELNYLTVQNTLRAVVRVNTKRLGPIEAQITGASDCSLKCQFTSEYPATAKLIARSTQDLAAAFSSAGWAKAEVSSRVGIQEGPLWYGGQDAGGPRRHVDKRI